MALCKECGEELSKGQYVIFNNQIYKACPECSKNLGQHAYYKCPDDFGMTDRRVTYANPLGMQSYCVRCRGNQEGPYNDVVTCNYIMHNGGKVINDTHNLPAIIKRLQEKVVDSYECKIPEEVSLEDLGKLTEGNKTTITINTYERNTQARKRCIEYYKLLHHGKVKCEICGFDFGKVYGTEFEGKINVHHLKEIATIGKEYEIDAEKDLIPICPNCHLVAHSKVPAYTPEEIRHFIQDNED